MKYKLIQEGELFRIEDTEKRKPIESADCDCGMFRSKQEELTLYTLITESEYGEMIAQVEFSVPLFIETTRSLYSCGDDGWGSRFIDDMTELRDAIQGAIDDMQEQIDSED
jgi:hypothetical protein